ncbi:uncharacterized protein LOC100904433 [Galendromus occidentalis]|uniref:Uncharacterized protein LOC100904433 n=1 Tax=Galendromus occidentalis TaxID=34638 RepID=A0AAJ6QXX8_9ACAR|nr:uncharacterized protein LOC100904433 [Galendromus occidentalis]
MSDVAQRIWSQTRIRITGLYESLRPRAVVKAARSVGTVKRQDTSENNLCGVQAGPLGGIAVCALKPVSSARSISIRTIHRAEMNIFSAMKLLLWLAPAARKVLDSDEISRRDLHREPIGQVSDQQKGNSEFKSKVEATVELLRKKLTGDPSSEQWNKTLREAIGDGVFTLVRQEAHWYFDGLQRERVQLLGEPPDSFKSLDRFKFFGFETLHVQWLREKEACSAQYYRILFPRVQINFGSVAPEEEYVLDTDYLTKQNHCARHKRSFSEMFYEFMVWWSCEDRKLDRDTMDLLAQTSWYIAYQMDMHGGPYRDRNEWCLYCKRGRLASALN